MSNYDIRENHTIRPWLDDPYIDGEAHDQKTREALILMARNYEITETLRDDELFEPIEDFLEAKTTGEFIKFELGRL